MLPHLWAVALDQLLQWGGFACLIAGYWFLVKPKTSALLTLLGCVSIGVWAFLQDPIPLGIVALEAAVGGIALRNIRDASRPKSAARPA